MEQFKSKILLKKEERSLERFDLSPTILDVVFCNWIGIFLESDFCKSHQMLNIKQFLSCALDGQHKCATSQTLDILLAVKDSLFGKAIKGCLEFDGTVLWMNSLRYELLPRLINPLAATVNFIKSTPYINP